MRGGVPCCWELLWVWGVTAGSGTRCCEHCDRGLPRERSSLASAAGEGTPRGGPSLGGGPGRRAGPCGQQEGSAGGGTMGPSCGLSCFGSVERCFHRRGARPRGCRVAVSGRVAGQILGLCAPRSGSVGRSLQRSQLSSSGRPTPRALDSPARCHQLKGARRLGRLHCGQQRRRFSVSGARFLVRSCPRAASSPGGGSHRALGSHRGADPAQEGRPPPPKAPLLTPSR